MDKMKSCHSSAQNLVCHLWVQAEVQRVASKAPCVPAQSPWFISNQELLLMLEHNSYVPASGFSYFLYPLLEYLLLDACMLCVLTSFKSLSSLTHCKLLPLMKVLPCCIFLHSVYHLLIYYVIHIHTDFLLPSTSKQNVRSIKARIWSVLFTLCPLCLE